VIPKIDRAVLKKLTPEERQIIKTAAYTDFAIAQEFARIQGEYHDPNVLVLPWGKTVPWKK
jgi:hypothetical protein